MRVLFSSYIRKCSIKMGVDVRRWRAPVDLRAQENLNVMQELYRYSGKKVLFNIKLSNCRHLDLLAYACTPNSMSPYIRTLKEYHEGICTTYTGSKLECYYNNFQPRNGENFLNIGSLNCADFNHLDAHSVFFPWFSITPLEAQNNFRKIERNEAAAQGLKLNFNDGYRDCGPVKKEKGEFEFGRLVKVYNSIKNNGYIVLKNNEDLIKGFYLFGDQTEQGVFQVMGGNHRVAALVALGYKTIPFLINTTMPFGLGGVVRRSDIRWWPGVVSNYYTLKEANLIFDRVLYAHGQFDWLRANNIS